MSDWISDGSYKVKGVYSRPHPGGRAMSSTHRGWWAQLVVPGGLLNVYQITRWGNEFWYPGGYRGLMALPLALKRRIFGRITTKLHQAST